MVWVKAITGSSSNLDERINNFIDEANEHIEISDIKLVEISKSKSSPPQFLALLIIESN